MSEHTNSSRNPQPTIIGPACQIRGDMHLEGDAAIFGSIEGGVEITGNLQIGASGDIHGAVQAGTLALQGRVEGEVRCAGSLDLAGRIDGNVVCGQTVQIGAKATLVGDVHAKAVTIIEGAMYRGHVVIGAQPAAETVRGEAHLEQTPSTVGRIDTTGAQAAVSGLLRRRHELLSRAAAVGS